MAKWTNITLNPRGTWRRSQTQPTSHSWWAGDPSQKIPVPAREGFTARCHAEYARMVLDPLSDQRLSLDAEDRGEWRPKKKRSKSALEDAAA